jgi:hypothetical protein
MRERCQHIRLTAEVVNLTFSPAHDHTEPALEMAARALMQKMEHWYSLLPVDLQFYKDLLLQSMSCSKSDVLRRWYGRH